MPLSHLLWMCPCRDCSMVRISSSVHRMPDRHSLFTSGVVVVTASDDPLKPVIQCICFLFICCTWVSIVVQSTNMQMCPDRQGP